MLTLGSIFSGIGGFELGLERAIPNLKTIWQIEKNDFCRRVLAKHWPNARRYNDITKINYQTLSPVDIICAGFPCQDISLSGKRAGLGGKKSGLWFNLYKCIRVLRPQYLFLENVPAIINNGLSTIAGQLAQIGYDMQWGIVSAKTMGAPHLRRRWFAIAYPISTLQQKHTIQPLSMGKKHKFKCVDSAIKRIHKANHWEKFPTTSGLCRTDDGIPNRVDRIRALGNSIVPQCSEYIGLLFMQSVNQLKEGGE